MHKDYSQILNHIKDIKTKQTVKKFIDSLLVVEQKNISYITDFMTPNEIEYCKRAINTFYSGDYEILPDRDSCERNCILLHSVGEYFDEDDYIDYISCARINDNIDHRDVLGSILGLGISRNKIGDIIFTDDEIIIILKNSLTNFVISNLNSIGKYKVEFRRVDKIDFNKIQDSSKSYIGIVSSLRIDVVLSEITNLSRKNTGILIKSGKIKINHEVSNKNHIELEEGDLISVRGYGRYRLNEVLGKTRKDKLRIDFEKFE